MANTVLFSSQTVPSLFLVLLGSIDCLTTVIGTMFFGATELNPILSGLVNTNLPVFVIVKLAVTLAVSFIFILANKTLVKIPDKENNSFKVAHRMLRFSYFGIVLFLMIVVINNVFVLFEMM